MGTINERAGRDGRVTFRAQVRWKRGQETLFSEAKTFARRRDAEGWIKRMEKALDGADPAPFAMRHTTVATVVERYLGETHRKIGKTKEQCLRAIAAMEFGSLNAVDADQTAIIALMAALRRAVQPQTVANYTAHRPGIYTIPKPSYRIEEMQPAKVLGRAMGLPCKNLSPDSAPGPDRDGQDHGPPHRERQPPQRDADAQDRGLCRELEPSPGRDLLPSLGRSRCRRLAHLGSQQEASRREGRQRRLDGPAS